MDTVTPGINFTYHFTDHYHFRSDILNDHQKSQQANEEQENREAVHDLNYPKIGDVKGVMKNSCDVKHNDHHQIPFIPTVGNPFFQSIPCFEHCEISNYEL